MSEGRPRDDDRPPTVVLLTDTPAFGGAEVYLLTLVRRLGSRYRFAMVMGEHGPEALRCGLPCPVTSVPGLARRPRAGAIGRVARTVRRLRPDLVHLNLTDQGDGLGLVVGGRASVRPVVATLHDVIPDRGPGRERVAGWALRRCRRVIAPSRAIATAVSELGARPAVVLHGLDFPRADRAQARARLGLDPGALVVGGVGRLHHQKGWDVLGRAAARVPHAQFLVVGDGPLRGTLAAAFPDLRFAGHRPDAASLMAAFDVVAAPSRYEAFGLAVAEALAAGVPVVAAAVDALPEVVGPGGRLVAPEDPDALAGALTELLADPGRRAELGAAGRAWARERFTAERMAAETAAVFDAAIAGRR